MRYLGFENVMQKAVRDLESMGIVEKNCHYRAEAKDRIKETRAKDQKKLTMESAPVWHFFQG